MKHHLPLCPLPPPPTTTRHTWRSVFRIPYRPVPRGSASHATRDSPPPTVINQPPHQNQPFNFLEDKQIRLNPRDAIRERVSRRKRLVKSKKVKSTEGQRTESEPWGVMWSSSLHVAVQSPSPFSFCLVFSAQAVSLIELRVKYLAFIQNSI